MGALGLGQPTGRGDARQKRLATLLEEVREVRLEEGVLVLVFPDGNTFSRMTLEDPENRQLVSGAVEGAFGRRLAVEYRFLSASPRVSAPGRLTEPEGAHRAPPADPASHPLVQEALRLFGGRLLPPDRRTEGVPF